METRALDSGEPQGSSRQGQSGSTMPSAKKLKLSGSKSGSSSKKIPVAVSWQNSMVDVKEKWRYLLDNHTFSDVTLLVGEEGERIPAHRLILSLNSPVFEVMFNDRWNQDCQKCQKRKPQRSGGVANLNSNEIELPALDPTAFRYFLRYIYTDEFDVPLEEIIDVLHVAEFLDHPVLAEKCQEILNTTVDASNALVIYEKTQKSMMFQDSDIEKMCLEYVMFHAKKILKSEDVLGLSQHSWCKLLKYDRLRIDEAALFNALCKWAEASCRAQDLEPTGSNIRRVIGEEMLSLVRFPLMSSVEFTMDVAERKGLLTDAEVISVYKRISCIGSRNDDLRKLPSSRFSEVPRHQTHIISILKTKSAHVCKAKLDPYDGTEDSIVFTINREINLIGVGAYGIQTAPENEFDIEIFLAGVNEEGDIIENISYVRKIIKSADSMTQVIPILFRSPAHLVPGRYELRYAAKGPETFYNANAGALSKSVNINIGKQEQIRFVFDGPMSIINTKHHIPQLYFSL